MRVEVRGGMRDEDVGHTGHQDQENQERQSYVGTKRGTAEDVIKNAEDE